jgi:transcriptional regulator with XRE-family HTH domain
MGISKAFGAVLQRFRLKAKFSQELLAERAGIDRTYVSLLERGRRTPTLQTIADLAAALAVSPVDLVAATMEDLGEDRRRDSHLRSRKRQ